MEPPLLLCVSRNLLSLRRLCKYPAWQGRQDTKVFTYESTRYVKRLRYIRLLGHRAGRAVEEVVETCEVHDHAEDYEESDCSC